MQKELTAETLQQQINEAQESPKPKYDPSKAYKWDKSTTFTMTGTEFGIAYNFLKEFIGSPISPISMLKVNEVYNILQSVLKTSVEAGESVEHTQEEQQTT